MTLPKGGEAKDLSEAVARHDVPRVNERHYTPRAYLNTNRSVAFSSRIRIMKA
jgi:hypothetical protein